MMDGNDPQGTAPVADEYERSDETADIVALLDDPDDLDDEPEDDDESDAGEVGDEPTDDAEPEEGEEPEADEADDADDSDEAEATDLSDVELFLPDGRKVNRKQIEAAFSAERDMKAAFTRKTQEIAEYKRSVDQHAEALTQQKQYLDQIIPYAQELLQTALPEPPNEEDYARDPIGAMAKERAYKRAQEQQGAIHQAVEYRRQEQAQEQQRVLEQRKHQMHNSLLERHPELAKPQAFQAFESKLADTFTHYGLDPRTLSQLADDRMVRVFEDAMAYRDLKAAKPKVMEKAKTAAPVVKPGVRKTNDGRTKRRSDLEAKLRRTGDPAYADALFVDLID